MDALTVGAAARQTSWSPRMLRYLEDLGLVVPQRTPAGYRVYGLARAEPAALAPAAAGAPFGIDLDEMAFAARLRREPELRAAVDAWLATADDSRSWIEWEQRKHERLLAA